MDLKESSHSTKKTEKLKRCLKYGRVFVFRLLVVLLHASLSVAARIVITACLIYFGVIVPAS